MIVISVMYLIRYFYQRENKYLTIENGLIKENGPFGKKIKLTDINQMEKYAGIISLKQKKLN